MKLPDYEMEKEPFIPAEAYGELEYQGSAPVRRANAFIPRFSVNVCGFLLISILNIAFCVFIFISTPGSCNAVEGEPEHYYCNPLDFSAAPPSRDVDAAWEHLSRNMILGLTRADVERLGKDPSTAVKFSPAWRVPGGDGLYLGVLDVFHQVHCLDMLRRNLVFNYGYYNFARYGLRPEAFRERHLRHCTSVLLQNIMCHADTEVVTHVWRAGNPVPWPDFGVRKQCRDFNALLDFRDRMDVEGSWDKFRLYTEVPDDAVVLPEEEGLAELRATADEFRDGEYYKDIHIQGCNA
ncbi:hypothetical protein PWT90_06096 [Aphanocladium album]|nr:hypothetical protein PWT90_06096 [Aphanocladium album]